MINEENKDKNTSRTHVHIFGKEVRPYTGKDGAKEKEGHAEHEGHRGERGYYKKEWRWEHRRRHGGMFWGLLVLLIGIILLLNGIGLISHQFWAAILPFWPVILIIWGLDILLGGHSLGRILTALIAVAICVAVIIYGLARINPAAANSLPSNVSSIIYSSQLQQSQQTNK